MLAGLLSARGESFEEQKAGGFTRLETPAGVWTAGEGQAEVHAGHAKSGRQSLRLTGGGAQEMVLKFSGSLDKPGRLTFWAERWTSKGPFEFRVETAAADGAFKEVWNGDAVVKVGGFLTKVEVPLAAGVAQLKFRCKAPAASGVMLDDLMIAEEKPMRLLDVSAVKPVVPVLVGKSRNPVLALKIATEGALEPQVLEAVELDLEGTTRPADVAEVELVWGGEDPSGGFGERFGNPAKGGRLAISGKRELAAGDNWLWVSLRLKDDADPDGRVDAVLRRVKISGKVVELPRGASKPAQRIGVALRQHGDDGSKAFRIPGLARTKAGKLIAAYDVRYGHAGDLPADIDVGVNRSSDGGRTWSKMAIAIDMGKGSGDGVGDPCIFVDEVTGRIWIAALWSHGNRAWHGSGPGLEPDETGQLVLVHSDDDGRTWSKPRNITREVKDPAWRLLLAGPGTGITMKDGTLVFPAQFRAADGKPWSTLIRSKDRGESWQIGTGVKSDTTEAQLVELADGSIMINCRDNRGGARTVAVTRDLGASWELHPTDRKALPESVCMASLLRTGTADGKARLFYSNPATTSGRHSMTIKVSADEGMSWPEQWHTLYDVRSGAGYSCLAMADESHLGVLYEGPSELYFLRLPVDELTSGKAADGFDPGTGAREGAGAALIPFPREVEWGGGVLEGNGWRVEAAGSLGRAKPVLEDLPKGDLKLEVRTGALEGGDEAYELSVAADGVRLTGAGDLGLLRGLATLEQLAAGGKLPWVEIRDWPAFEMRGFMHDTGRNFQEIGTLERFVELLAAYKMNVFHWHLTDNPGYRIESKRHPELNEVRAYRETRSPGKYYSFEQIRGLIRKAHALGVEVLPEIDMPGHSEYFAKAFGFDMQDPRGMAICLDLLDEFHREVVLPLRAEGIPMRWLHLGADEVHIKNRDFLPAMVKRLAEQELQPVLWRPGALPDHGCVTQLWAKGQPVGGVRYIDSAMNYVNHMDFFDSVPHAFFHQPCGRPSGDGQALGAILCHWPDINAGEESNIYRQSPVVPALLAGAERFWRGLPRSHPDLWARLPVAGDPRLEAFTAFEKDVLDHGERLAKEWPFPYAGQSEMRWQILGPFDHGGEVGKAFAPENMDHFESIEVDGKRFEPIEAVGGTVHLRHFFDMGGVLPGKPQAGTVYAESFVWSPDAREIDCWIGFNSFSTSDRRGGPVPAGGEWSNAGAKVWWNGVELRAPDWANAGYAPKQMWSDERPFADELYASRAPTRLKLKPGWNRVLLKAPRRKDGWKWMFTFLPVGDLPGLRFSSRRGD